MATIQAHVRHSGSRVSVAGENMMRQANPVGLLAGLFMLVAAGCTSHESRLYQGQVVDEQGAPVRDVTVKLCYTGWAWDWSMAGGFPLVMGHPYCSDRVVTDPSGRYRVRFAGPASTFVLARHPDWIQTRSFPADGGRVVLVRRVVYSQRRRAQDEAKESAFRRPRANESATGYYCRVVARHSGVVELDYHGRRIRVVQALLAGEGGVVFAVAAPYDVVQALAEDVTIHQAGPDAARGRIDRFTAAPRRLMCEDTWYFVRSSAPDVAFAVEHAGDAEIEVASLRAVFSMKPWTIPKAAAR